jgi:hypothetical protein
MKGAACTLLLGLALAAGLPASSLAETDPSPAARLSAAALARTEVPVTYDPAYVRLAYPGGDVAADRGVCADVVLQTTHPRVAHHTHDLEHPAGGLAAGPIDGGKADHPSDGACAAEKLLAETPVDHGHRPRSLHVHP